MLLKFEGIEIALEGTVSGMEQPLKIGARARKK
jgi:hypothetical protein